MYLTNLNESREKNERTIWVIIMDIRITEGLNVIAGSGEGD